MTPTFLLSCLLVCVGMAVADAFWTIYVTKANEGRAHAAGFASVAIVLVNSYVVFEYVHDRRLVFAAAIGAYIGTIIPIFWKARRGSAPK